MIVLHLRPVIKPRTGDTEQMLDDMRRAGAGFYDFAMEEEIWSSSNVKRVMDEMVKSVPRGRYKWI